MTESELTLFSNAETFDLTDALVDSKRRQTKIEYDLPNLEPIYA